MTCYKDDMIKYYKKRYIIILDTFNNNNDDSNYSSDYNTLFKKIQKITDDIMCLHPMVQKINPVTHI